MSLYCIWTKLWDHSAKACYVKEKLLSFTKALKEIRLCIQSITIPLLIVQ